jgi:hypothetical protein
VRFRLTTQYGRAAAGPGDGPPAAVDADDVVEYLEWCRTVVPERRR